MIEHEGIELTMQPDNHIKFVSPYALDECINRLASASEKTTFWAARGAMRTVVEVSLTSENTARFRIRRLSKSPLALDLGFDTMTLEGVLTRKTSAETLVQAHLRKSILAIALQWVALLLMLILFVVIQRDTTQFAVICCGGVLGLGLVIAVTVWSENSKRQHLFEALEKTLR